jgi:hypothetical protein
MGPGVDMQNGVVQMEGSPVPDMTVEEFAELAASIMVMVPHRSNEGIHYSIANSVGFWARWGMSYAPINDDFAGNIAETRAGMCRAFLDIAAVHPRYKFLVMIDNDEVIDPLMPLKLCRWNEPLVSGVVCTGSEHGSIKACFTKKDRYGNVRFPTVVYTGRMPARGLIEVESCGAGLVAIRLDALQAVADSGEIPFYIPDIIRREHWKTGVLAVGEDIAFCKQLAKLGIPRYVDLSVRAIHMKTLPVAWPLELIDEDLAPEDWEIDPRDILHNV